MPDPVVLAFENRSYRRSELDAEVNGFAAALRHSGVRPGDRVALMSSNRPEFVVALYAIWRVGAAVVMADSAEPRSAGPVRLSVAVTPGCGRLSAMVSVTEALEVGFGEADITPPLGYPMAGYYHERLSTGVRDPLKAKAICPRE